MSFRKQPKTLSAATKRINALLDELQLSNLKEEQEVVIAMEYHKIFDVKALWGYSKKGLIEGGFPASAAHELVAKIRGAYDQKLKRYENDRAFVQSPHFNGGGKVMLAADYKGNHEDVYRKYGLTSSDVRQLDKDFWGIEGQKAIPIQGFCHKDTTDVRDIPEDQYKGKISHDWFWGMVGNAAKQGERLEKMEARGLEAIEKAAGTGSLDGDAAVLLDICRENPHIAEMKKGWPPTSSDLSQVQLDGVTVNSTGQVTKLLLPGWQLTGENFCSTSATTNFCLHRVALHNRRSEGTRNPRSHGESAQR